MDGSPGLRPKLSNKDVRFGSWNVRTLAVPGKVDILNEELEMYRMDIVALQETKWPFCGKINTKSYQILYSGCDDGRHYAGVGFAVKKQFLESVIAYEAISERICTIRFKGKFNNISVISLYAPTEDSEDEEKDMFYAQLEEVFLKLPSYDTKVLIGDANAKVGRETVWRSVTGGHSLHKVSNDNGVRLLSFATSMNLFISSTSFPHKEIHKETWTSPNGRTKNQIDHVLVDKRHARTVVDVKSQRGAECGTDHYLLLAVLRQRIKIEKRKVKRVMEKIYFDEDKRLEFQVKITNRFDALATQTTEEEEADVEQLWRDFKTSIKETAKDVFAKKRLTKKPWFNEKCRELVKRRKEIKINYLKWQSMEAREAYKEVNKEVNKTLRMEKRKFINNKLIKAEQDLASNNTKDFHRSVRFFQKGYTPKVFGVKDKDGNIIGEVGRVLQTWEHFFKDLLNADNISIENGQEVNEHEENQYIPEPTLEEIENVIKTFKNEKAPGEDGIPIEVIKKGGRSLIQFLHKLIVRIWNLEVMPREWQEAVIVPLYKKGDKQDCSNYRGISLLNCTYKIVSKIILNRLKPYGEEIIGEQQAGFMKGKSTIDQIFIMKELASKYWEYNKNLYVLFVDFKKAYDSIIRSKLWTILKQNNIPEKLIRLIRMCVENSRGKVRIDREYTNSFDIGSGVRQGDGLSPLLFNFALEEALKITKSVPRGANIEGRLNVLAFADDVALLADNKNDLKVLAEVLVREAGKVGLHVNQEKTKYMKIGREAEPLNSTLEVMDYKFSLTEEFKYLGITINSHNKMDQEIQMRISAANRCYWSLLKLFKSKLLSRITKIRIYVTIIQPVLLYGSEVWTLTKYNQKRLITFENKVLRRIYGPTCEAGVWRIKRNGELRELYGRPDVVAGIRSRRIRWLGHVSRRGEDESIRRVWMGKPDGRRPLGRPRIRWDDQVGDDVRRLGGDIEMAGDRKVWRQLVGEAKDRLGFERPQE